MKVKFFTLFAIIAIIFTSFTTSAYAWGKEGRTNHRHDSKHRKWVPCESKYRNRDHHDHYSKNDKIFEYIIALSLINDFVDDIGGKKQYHSSESG